MPDYDIDYDIEDNISDPNDMGDVYTTQHGYVPGTHVGGIDTSGLTTQQMAGFGQTEDDITEMLRDLGITDPSAYAQFVEKYDPAREILNQEQMDQGIRQLKQETRSNLIQQAGESLGGVAGIAAKRGFEGAGDISYMSRMKDIDVEGAADKYDIHRDQLEIDRKASDKDLWDKWSSQFYSTAGDIYAQQQQPEGGKGK